MFSTKPLRSERLTDSLPQLGQECLRLSDSCVITAKSSMASVNCVPGDALQNKSMDIWQNRCVR